MNVDQMQVIQAVVMLTDVCHTAAFDAGWWHVKSDDVYPAVVRDIWPDEKRTDVRDLPSGVLKFWVGTKLALIHTEVSEAVEGHRKSLPDDKLPHRSMFEVELADAMIRILDLAGGLNVDLAGAVVDKLAFNATRADHRPEEREKEGGKSY